MTKQIKFKESFIIHHDTASIFQELTNEQAGELIKYIIAYSKEINENPKKPKKPSGFSSVISLIAHSFEKQLERDFWKYQEVVKRNTENGSKGGRPNKNFAKQNPKKPDSDNDNVSDNDSDNKKECNAMQGIFSKNEKAEQIASTEEDDLTFEDFKNEWYKIKQGDPVRGFNEGYTKFKESWSKLTKNRKKDFKEDWKEYLKQSWIKNEIGASKSPALNKLHQDGEEPPLKRPTGEMEIELSKEFEKANEEFHLELEKKMKTSYNHKGKIFICSFAEKEDGRYEVGLVCANTIVKGTFRLINNVRKIYDPLSKALDVPDFKIDIRYLLVGEEVETLTVKYV